MHSITAGAPVVAIGWLQVVAALVVRMAMEGGALQQRRRLTVTVHQCKGLVNKDGLFGKNDVYCVLSVESEQKRTSTVDEGGAEPVWEGGEQVTFSQPAGLRELQVDVFDHDDIGSDDLIGRQSVDLAQYEFEGADEDWSVGAPLWLELRNQNGKKKTGEIQLSFGWAEPQPDASATPAHGAGRAGAMADSPPFEYDSPGAESVAAKLEQAVDDEAQLVPRDVRVTVLQAADLLKSDFFGKNDPYVVLKANNQELRTQTVQNGGSDVSFGENSENRSGEELLFPRCEGTTCTVQCWDEDKGGADDLLGEGTLRLPTLAEAEASEAALQGRDGREVWVELSKEDKKGVLRPAGRVRVVVQAWDASVQPPPVHPAGTSSTSEEEEEVELTVEDAAEAQRQRNRERREEKANASDDLKAALILEDEGMAEAARCARGSWGTPDIVGLLSLLREKPHCDNPNVVARACGALQVVFDVDRMSRMHLDLRMRQEHGIEVLCDAILRHRLSGKVMETGFWVLETLMRDDGPGPAHMWEPHPPVSVSDGFVKPYGPEDFTTPGEWGGKRGAAGEAYRKVIVEKGMEAEARKVLTDNCGTACDSQTATRDPPSFLPAGSAPMDVLSGRSFARSFLEALGTATAEESARSVTPEALAELERSEKQENAAKAASKEGGDGKKTKKKKSGKAGAGPKQTARHARPGSRGDIKTPERAGGASTLDASGNLTDLSMGNTSRANGPEEREGDVSSW